MLKLEVSVHSYCPWSSLSVSTRGQKKTKLYSNPLMETTIEDNKSDVESGSLRCFWSLKVSQVWWGLICPTSTSESSDLYRIWWSSSASERRPILLIQCVDSLLTFLPIFHQSLWAFLVLPMFSYLLNTWWMYYMIMHNWTNISMVQLFFNILLSSKP